LVGIKDHDMFMRMAARVGAERPDVSFAIVGDGERRDELEGSLPPSIATRVTFTGWRTDLPTVYAALDVVVLTSRNEGTPVALIEAGAAGKPVVATDVGGVGDVVRPDETGALVPAGDDEAMSYEVLRAIADPALARSRGDAARTWVASRFTADRLAGDIASLYRELLAAS
jgi:glycosyltransferase involved in cell wall biosynthesis